MKYQNRKRVSSEFGHGDPTSTRGRRSPLGDNMKRFLKAGLVLALIGTGVVSQAATELVIATVNNGHMIEMQKLTPFFEKAYPDIKLK
jgi:hypothetical protein